MDNEKLKARRAQWQRMYDEDVARFGAAHPATEMDAAMLAQYDALLGRTVAEAQSERLASEARANERDDNGPARIRGEW
jgi:hypothetical protein